MSAYLLTAPAAEPLSLADAKTYLRVEHDDDDATIAALIASARSHIEALTRCRMIAQTWRVVLDRWPPSGRIDPRLAPLRALQAVRVFNEANVASSVDVASFVVDRARHVIASPSWALPAPGRNAAGIELDVGIGFGDTAADVPAVLLQAVRALVAHWYDNRGLIAIGQSVSVMPLSVNAMINSYRVMSL